MTIVPNTQTRLATGPVAKSPLRAAAVSSQPVTSKLKTPFAAVLHQSTAKANVPKLNANSILGALGRPTTGQTSGTGLVRGGTIAKTGQIPVTGQTPAATAPATSASLETTNPAKIGFNALVQDTPPPPQTSATPTATHWYAANAADDAYWNAQPAAVQQLREIDDPAQRQALATQLAGQGYQIDAPIMVWGWDAGITNSLRASAGYTWVPSALQNNITAAPGLSGGGITPYDPNNPPPGSITVTG
jgi:hypothetical protein